MVLKHVGARSVRLAVVLSLMVPHADARPSAFPKAKRHQSKAEWGTSAAAADPPALSFASLAIRQAQGSSGRQEFAQAPGKSLLSIQCISLLAHIFSFPITSSC